MERDEQTEKRILVEQLEWTREQARLLDEMDVKLHEMRKIAEYAKEHELSPMEIERMNGELNKLIDEYNALERLYNPILQ